MLSNGIFIPDREYLPNENCSNEDSEEIPKPKRKRLQKNWIFEKTFTSKKEALESIKSENSWGYYYENTSEAGVKVTYRCNFVKFRGQQCSAGIYLLYDSTNTSVHLYRTDSSHNHDDDNIKYNAVDRISGALEAEIRAMFNAGTVKPKSILFSLVRKGLTPPKKEKLTAFWLSCVKKNLGLRSFILEHWKDG